MQVNGQEEVREKVEQLKRIDVFTFCFVGLPREVIKNPSARGNLHLSLKTMEIAFDKMPKDKWERCQPEPTPLLTFEDIRRSVHIDD